LAPSAGEQRPKFLFCLRRTDTAAPCGGRYG
jgi:hypothetical protein